jgi:hypothetical protein
MKARKKEESERRSRSPLKLLLKQESDPAETSTGRQTSKSPARDITDLTQSNDTRQPLPLDSKVSHVPSEGTISGQSSPAVQSQARPPTARAKSTSPKLEGASPTSSPPSISSTYDKRMPPPSVDWRVKGGSRSRPPRNEMSKDSQSTKVIDPVISTIEKSDQISSVESIVDKMVREAQKPDAPAAKGSFITGKRNQLDFREVKSNTAGDDIEVRKIMNGYLRDGDDRIGILSSSWEEVSLIPESNNKRPNEDGESSTAKKRKLRSKYCPASHTTWKPSWLDTTQCYPVDQAGEDMSEVECLRGDAIHRNADKLKQILETECMYIPTHRVDELIHIAQETTDILKRTKEFCVNEKKRIRIERHQFM